MRDEFSKAAPIGSSLGGIAGAQSARLPDLLACPDCSASPLSFGTVRVECTACGSGFPIVDGIIDFTRPKGHSRPPMLYNNPCYKKFMENLSAIHDAHYHEGGVSAWIEKKIKTSICRILAAKPEYIVDLGCGSGDGFDAYGRPEIVIGVDAYMPLLQVARKRYPEATLVCADLTTLPFAPGSVDVFVANAVLEHVFYLEKAVEDAARCLSLGGHFYVLVPTEGGILVDCARLVTSRRNAAILGIKPAESRTAQRIDHCNTVYAVENALWKYFEIEEMIDWPFRIGGANLNLSRAYRLRQRTDGKSRKS